MLSQLKYRYCNIKGVRNQIDSDKCLENPLVDGESVKVQCVLSSRFFKQMQKAGHNKSLLCPAPYGIYLYGSGQMYHLK